MSTGKTAYELFQSHIRHEISSDKKDFSIIWDVHVDQMGETHWIVFSPDIMNAIRPGNSMWILMTEEFKSFLKQPDIRITGLTHLKFKLSTSLPALLPISITVPTDAQATKENIVVSLRRICNGLLSS